MSSEFQGSKVPEDDSALLRNVSERILASRSKIKNECVKCISVGMTQNKPISGCALLVGLSSKDAEWDADNFLKRYTTQLSKRKNHSSSQWEVNAV